MSDVYRFKEYAGSGRGLMARPVLPGNRIAFLADIESIDYAVYNTTDGGPAVTGSLVVADVMLAAVDTWARDGKGYSFLWPAPGSLWPLAGKVYRIVVSFHLKEDGAGDVFIETWEVTTTNPAVP